MPSIPLILLPGLLCDSVLWGHQIKALKDVAECKVADLSQHQSMAALARSVLADAPPQFALAGLSMGGYVAFEIMRLAPERVLRLCLLDTTAQADSPEQLRRRELLVSLSQQGQFKGVTPRLLPNLIHISRLKDEALTDTIFGMAGRVGRDGFIRQMTAIMRRQDSRPFLPAITCPLQLIGGQQDLLTPPELLREIADQVRHARLAVIPSCGHLSALEQPEKVSTVMLEWLQRSA